MTEAVGRSAARKKKARQGEQRNVWFGFGMFGLVGWAVALPAIAGVALGLWLDLELQSQLSWTLALLLAGVGVGCLNAWYWINRESRDD
jgi:ATP synthase protein I